MVHLSWDVMLGLGTFLLFIAAWFGFVWWRKRDIPKTKWFLRIVAISGVAAVLCMEAGWVLTETGRQPWVVYKVLRTSDAVTSASGIWGSFAIAMAIYAAVISAAVIVIRRMTKRWREVGTSDHDVPYGPPPTDIDLTHSRSTKASS
ncbi:unannotated protein [freshwater metagenome]|uniref:Unannotated protein n=1 Tax=freshwater metagenome TaxID=449393 RepID=A0A6J6SFX8_9ZZZZ